VGVQIHSRNIADSDLALEERTATAQNCKEPEVGDHSDTSELSGSTVPSSLTAMYKIRENQGQLLSHTRNIPTTNISNLV
jgi:hypothetical protein